MRVCVEASTNATVTAVEHLNLSVSAIKLTQHVTKLCMHMDRDAANALLQMS